MNKCYRCGSYAINHHAHGRDGSEPELCDVCYWRKRAEAQRESDAQLILRTDLKLCPEEYKGFVANALKVYADAIRGNV